MSITLLTLDMEEALGAGPARLVHHDERLRTELVLLGKPRDQARHLIGPPAGAGGDHELDGLGGLPGRGGRGRCERDKREGRDESRETSPLTDHVPSFEVGAGPFAARAERSYLPGRSFQNGMTPGISHLFHISSTFAWK
jgi:hypothetical protein